MKILNSPVYKKWEFIRKESKCMADRVLNYYQYANKKLNIISCKQVEILYKNLRVDGYFGKGDPRCIAGGMVWLNAVMEGEDVTQRLVAETLDISPDSVKIWGHRLEDKITFEGKCPN